MSVEDLYKELGVDYTQYEQDQFFDELISAAKNVKGKLGGRKSPKYRESLVNEIQQMKQELKDCTAEFSRFLEVYPLSENEFQVQGTNISPEIARLMEKDRFALVNIPIMLVPVKGWGFNSLDCIVTFNPDRPLDQHPVAYQLFPEEKWQKKFEFSQQLSIGVDEYLKFKAAGALPLPEETTPLSASAGVGTDIQGGFKLVLGPFNYSLSMPKIMTRGTGNDKVRWTLEDEENIQQRELKLGVVLKIPRHAKKVEIVGVMTLKRNFHLFNADVKYLVDYLKSRGQKFFTQGTPPVIPPGVWDITDKLKEG